MAALGDFIKKNASESASGKIGKGFIAFDVANLVTSENKLKSIWQLLKDLILLRPVLAAGFVGLFLSMGKSIRSLVHDTGSLEAALKKLSQIQGLQRMFTGILGGAAAAKLKVAELVNFAATRNIKLGDAAEASRSLTLMTKNGFSGAKALDVVNDAAKATNNTITGLADTVGEFSTALREGDSIQSATDNLRQMGVINDTTAASFIRLQQNGATADQIFGALTTSLKQFEGGARDAAGSIDGINEAREKAAANLQEKFGSPFAADDITNTKNYTAAMTALAPAVGRLGKFFEALTGGFSTVKSSFVEFAAGSKIARGALEGLVYVLGTAVTVAGVLGASSLSKFFRGLSVSIAESTAQITAQTILGSQGMNAFGKSLSFVGVNGKTTESILVKTSGAMARLTGLAPTLTKALSFLPAVGVGIAIGAAVKKWIDSIEEAAIALQEVQKGQNQANAAIAAQINSVRTLADMHDAVTAALKRELDARNELIAAEADGDKKKIAAAESALKRAEINSQKAARINQAKLGPTPEETAATLRDIQRGKDEREARFQAKLSLARPSERARLNQTHIEELTGTVGRGEKSEEATIAFSRERAKRDIDVADAQGALANAQAELERRRAKASTIPTEDVFTGATNTAEIEASTRAIKEQELAVASATERLKLFKNSQARVGQNAPVGTTTEIRSRLLQNELSGDRPEVKAQKAYYIQRELDRALMEEKETGANRLERIQERASQAALNREILLNRLQAQRELDIQDAEAHKDGKTKQRIEDFSVFADKYQQLLEAGFTETEAEKAAKQFANNAVTLNNPNTGAVGQVADSLARIGGGGGVGGPTGDAMLTIAQRQVAIADEMRNYLKTIATKGDKGVF